MADNVAGKLSLRALREDDLPTMFEIQLDDTAQRRDAVIKKVVEIDGEVVGSEAAFPIEGDTEVTYWIRKDWWGRGVATAAVAALLEEVTVRPPRGAQSSHLSSGAAGVGTTPRNTVRTRSCAGAAPRSTSSVSGLAGGDRRRTVAAVGTPTPRRSQVQRAAQMTTSAAAAATSARALVRLPPSAARMGNFAGAVSMFSPLTL
jgi:hypothetical protein